MPRTWAVVPAAGCGERFGDACPKQFTIIQGHTLISFTIASLLMCDEVEKVIVVTSDQNKVGSLPLWWKPEFRGEENVKPLTGQGRKNSMDYKQSDVAQHGHKGYSAEQTQQSMNETRNMHVDKHEMQLPLVEDRVVYVAGSTSRHRSIKCGLDAIEELLLNGSGPTPEVVLVHDGVRPLVPSGLVSALVTAAAADGAAGLTRPLVSTVLETPPDHHGRLGHSLDRSRHRASETPQAFSYAVIRRAYQQCSEYELDHGTECLQLALTHAGVAARLLDGSPDLWKVTYRHDLHAFRGVVDDVRIRLAVVSATATVEDMLEGLVRLLSARLRSVSAVSVAELTSASRPYSCLVFIRPAAMAGVTLEPATETAATGLEAAALLLDRRLPGYVVDVSVGQMEAVDAVDPVVDSEGWCQRTGKWLCRVVCGGRPADKGRQLAALLTAVLLSEQGAFHGQVLRL